jgi:hypothetical protein
MIPAMARSDASMDKIIEALRERAKELHCLYNVHELLNRPDTSVQDVCHDSDNSAARLAIPRSVLRARHA